MMGPALGPRGTRGWRSLSQKCHCPASGLDAFMSQQWAGGRNFHALSKKGQRAKDKSKLVPSLVRFCCVCVFPVVVDSLRPKALAACAAEHPVRCVFAALNLFCCKPRINKCCCSHQAGKVWVVLLQKKFTDLLFYVIPYASIVISKANYFYYSTVRKGRLSNRIGKVSSVGNCE